MKTNNIQRVAIAANGNTIFVTRRGMVEVNKRAKTVIFYGERPDESANRSFYCSGGFQEIVNCVRRYAAK